MQHAATTAAATAMYVLRVTTVACVFSGSVSSLLRMTMSLMQAIEARADTTHPRSPATRAVLRWAHAAADRTMRTTWTAVCSCVEFCSVCTAQGQPWCVREVTQATQHSEAQRSTAREGGHAPGREDHSRAPQCCSPDAVCTQPPKRPRWPLCASSSHGDAGREIHEAHLQQPWRLRFAVVAVKIFSWKGETRQGVLARRPP